MRPSRSVTTRRAWAAISDMEREHAVVELHQGNRPSRTAIFYGDPPVWPLDDEAMAAGGRALTRSGARIVGGCCGTTPLFIERLGRSLS